MAMPKRKIICGIYKITNTDNGKMYIGQSNDVIDRIRHHKSSLKYNRHENKKLQYSYNKHGEKAFKFELLEECLEDKLDEREIYWIAKLKTYVGFKDCNGYNLTTGGEGTRSIHPVLQFDLTGKFIAEWQNGIIASQRTGISASVIYGTCVKRLKRADKYIFIYKENYKSIEDLKWYLSSKKMKPINQYDLNGSFIKQWNGVEEIRRELGYIPNGSILKTSMSYNGYIFRYFDDIDDLSPQYFIKAKQNSETLKDININQYDINGKFIKNYSSLREVIRNGFSRYSIVKCLKGEKDSYKGYIWKYA